MAAGQPGKAGKTATANVTIKSVSNSGQMSTSSHKTGATGAVRNTTNIYSSGDPGAPGNGWNSDLLKNLRTLMGL
jgi:hypothetical protein